MTAVVGAYGGESAEAAAATVAGEAVKAAAALVARSPLRREGRVWDGQAGGYVVCEREEEAAAFLADPRAVQAGYYRSRQGWLDRGTVLNRALDAMASGMVKPAHCCQFVAGVLEEPAGFSERGDPYPWQCGQQDALDRAAWLADWFDKRGRGVIVQTGHRAFDADRLLTGEIDWIGADKDGPHIGEMKCGSEQKRHLLQVAAYWTLAGRGPEWLARLVYIRPDGWREVVVDNAALAWYAEAFDRLLGAYRTMEETPRWKTAALSSRS